MRSTPQPVVFGLAEKPKPGSEGQTTWKASAGLPPCATGSTSGAITFWNSTIEPGQPWVMISGSAAGSFERTCRKWMSSPSISVVNCSKRLSFASRARQS